MLGGKPVIRGTRISVAYILALLGLGLGRREDILRGHPHLTREGILAALDYAAEALESERILPLEVEGSFLRMETFTGTL
ncbi:MAG: DUF433 domain-containing protein [Candidatus Bipolaricaulota bacterium]|nr:DUF433 domain-containing protein [Candidatus Bipolaricaulota bacterium]